MSPLGTWLARSALAHAARLRERLLERWRIHGVPPIDDVKVVVIVGLHRTGTTLLQGLLGALPGWRTPRFVELHDPLASSVSGRATARLALWASARVSPEMRDVHPVTLDAPEECWMLLLPTLAARNWDLHLRLPRYGAWLDAADLRPAYRFYRQALATLVARWTPRPRVVVVKCPEHLWALDALTAALPGATIVWAHRDPARSVPSYASLSSLQHRAIYGRFDAAEVGRHISERFADGLARAIRVRAKLEAAGPGRFVDVAYRQLVDAPGEVASVIARAVGENVDTAVIVRAVVRATGDKRASRHHVDLASFGLDERALAERFAAYRERFAAYLGR